MSAQLSDNILRSYQIMLSNSAEGINFLFSSRFAETLRVPVERTAAQYGVTGDVAIEELRRLLAIKVFTADENATKISPTTLMDELWHAAILDTRLYRDLQGALGAVLDHRPSGALASDSEARANRKAAMKNIYRGFFSGEPIEHPIAVPRQPGPAHMSPQVQGRININVDVNGSRHRFLVSGHTKLEVVMGRLEQLTGLARSSFRVLYDGMRCDPNTTMRDLGITDGGILEVQEQKYGC